MFVTSKKMTAAILAITLAMSLSACSNWSKRDRNTAIGAGAGAIGGAMADILTAPVYAPATFIIKMLISLPITCKKDKIVNVHNCVGVVVAAVISFIGYYITDVILFGTWGALIPSIVGTLAQSGGSAVIFIILGSTLDKAGFKSTMKNKFGI